MAFSYSLAHQQELKILNTQFDKTTVVDKEFNDVWGYVIEWAAINSFPIESADKKAACSN